MFKLATSFVMSACVGAVLATATPSQAAVAGYWRRIHAHSCAPIGPFAPVEYQLHRLLSSGALVVSCPIPEDYTAGLATYANRTVASQKAVLTAYVYDPSPAAQVVVQVCSTRKNSDYSNCTTKGYSSSTGAAGYTTVAVTPNPYPASTSDIFPTLMVTLPAGSALNGVDVSWL